MRAMHLRLLRAELVTELIHVLCLRCRRLTCLRWLRRLCWHGRGPGRACEHARHLDRPLAPETGHNKCLREQGRHARACGLWRGRLCWLRVHAWCLRRGLLQEHGAQTACEDGPALQDVVQLLGGGHLQNGGRTRGANRLHALAGLPACKRACVRARVQKCNAV